MIRLLLAFVLSLVVGAMGSTAVLVIQHLIFA